MFFESKTCEDLHDKSTGGKDGAALAIYLKQKFPTFHF